VLCRAAGQLPYTIATSRNVVTVVFSPVSVAEPRVTTKKEIFTIAAAVPPEPASSATPHDGLFLAAYLSRSGLSDSYLVASVQTSVLFSIITCSAARLDPFHPFMK
jgi:hypothetical protein